MTILMNILPKKLTYFWMYTYLTLFATLTVHLDIGIMYILYTQIAYLRSTHTCIKQNQENNIITKPYRRTQITRSKHLFDMFRCKSRFNNSRRLRRNKS